MDFRVLVYSHDAQLFLLLQHVMATEGFSALHVANVNEAADRLRDSNVTAVMIDFSTPDLDDQVVHVLKSIRFNVIVILLCSVPGTDAAQAGADLVLMRPFDPAHLIAFFRRVRFDTLIGRNRASTHSEVLRFADLEMNIAKAKVLRNGCDIPLTALQFRLLRHLLRNSDAIQSREHLITACWPANTDVEPRTVDIHIGHIRRALKKAGPDLIRTVRSSGYILCLEAGRDRDG